MNISKRSFGEFFLDTIDHHIRWLFPTPAILVAGGLFIYPFIRLIYLSFNHWMLTTRQAPSFVGLANYIQAFTQDTHFWNSLWLTF